MNELILELADIAFINHLKENPDSSCVLRSDYTTDFAKLIVQECVNREELLGAISRGWCSEKNAHKTMDSDLASAIFDEVEKQIREKFGVEE